MVTNNRKYGTKNYAWVGKSVCQVYTVSSFGINTLLAKYAKIAFRMFNSIMHLKSGLTLIIIKR